jgi:glycosyltransferase involved in cell wall biosynthesis
LASNGGANDPDVSNERKCTEPSEQQLDDLQRQLRRRSIAFGIPSFNEGEGLVHTLKSLEHAVERLGLAPCPLILSDSSETTETVDAAREWARSAPIQLVVDRSERRRSAKEARNVIMDRARSDLLLQLDADVVLPTRSLYRLLVCLTRPPAPAVAVGSAVPDPAFGGVAHRASAWQLTATHRYASWLPENAVRAEGAFWGSWASFYRDYRFRVGLGPPVDDVDLAVQLRERGIPTRNCWKAFVYKVPADTLRDFAQQTKRGHAAVGPRRRTVRELGAAAIEASRDPVGAVLYLRARLRASRQAEAFRGRREEQWDVEQSTKRR